MECAQTEEAEADVLMQVPVAAKGRFAVVDVERAEVLHPHCFVEVVQRLLESHGCPQVVSSSVHVTRVETHSDSFLVVHECDDVAQVFKGRADDVAAAGHGFEDGRYRLGGRVGLVESLGYAGDGGWSGMAAGPAGVEIVEPDAEGFAAVEVVEEGVVGLGGLFGVFLGEVDEVGAVR